MISGGRARSLIIRGRGVAELPPSLEPIRRPGELRQTGANPYGLPLSHDDNVAEVRPFVHQNIDDILRELNAESVDENKLSHVASSLRSACFTPDHAKEAVEKLYKYAVLNKINAHYGGVLCKKLADFQVADVKFKIAFLKRLQLDYEDRKRKYADIDKFLNIVAVLCEVYHHLRIAEGTCYTALVPPIIDYLGMLVDGGSEKEIEAFVEQLTKCGRNLRSQDQKSFDETLLLKMRKQIIGISSVTSRNMLLHMFEVILNDWKPLSHSAETFYNAVCKQITPVCE